MKRVVGIGECIISDNPDDILVTYALASCVAVTVYSTAKKVSGMVHIVLPSPEENRENRIGPYYYAITGVPLMITRLCSEFGCLKSELSTRLFGGADSIREKDFFRLGRKNIMMVKDVLSNMSLKYDATETGGFISRTLEMNVSTGKILINTQPINI